MGKRKTQEKPQVRTTCYPEFLKKLHKEVAPILTCSIPLYRWRNVLVTPVYKKIRSQKQKNNRPISLICSYFKVLEYLITSNIMEYLDLRNLLSSNQHAFAASSAVKLNSYNLSRTSETNSVKAGKQTSLSWTSARHLTNLIIGGSCWSSAALGLAVRSLHGKEHS